MKKSILYLLHALIWATVILFIPLIGWRDNSGTWQFPNFYGILNSLLAAAWFIAIFYIFYSYLFPKFFKPKHYSKFFLFSFLTIFLLPIFFNITFGILLFLFKGSFGPLSLQAYFGGVAAAIFIGGLGSLFRIIIDWFTSTQEKSEYEKSKFDSELKLLKYQLNPHFLFNSLNNIDALIQQDNKKASLALNKLSELMRYVIYDSEKDKVFLKDEIKYIENYIDLQKLRFSDKNQITFNYSKDTDNIVVAPMLFITFIENAFKHSSLKNPENRIDIKLDVFENQLIFKCNNDMPASKIEKDESSGIGLSLVKKRLDLIYPGDYELKTVNSERHFNVYLKLNSNAN